MLHRKVASDLLFLVSPKPMLGGANEKFDIGVVCGSRGRASGLLILFKPYKVYQLLRAFQIYPSGGASLKRGLGMRENMQSRWAKTVAIV